MAYIKKWVSKGAAAGVVTSLTVPREHRCSRWRIEAKWKGVRVALASLISDHFGQPEPLRPSVARTRNETWGGDVRTSSAGSNNVQPRQPTSRNDQGMVSADGLTSRNGPGEQGAALPKQNNHAWSYNTTMAPTTSTQAGVQRLRTQSMSHSTGVQHLVAQSTQHHGYSSTAPIAGSAGVQDLGIQPTLRSAGVQNLENNVNQHRDEYSNPVQITGSAGVQDLGIQPTLRSTNIRMDIVMHPGSSALRRTML
jgi:hypothetical protein